MNENEMREARTRAAIRVARRLGADTEQLHDVLIAVRAGWTATAEKDGTLADVFATACGNAWRENGEPWAPGRSVRMLELLAVMWPDVIADCGREERELRKEEQRQAERADERYPPPTSTDGWRSTTRSAETSTGRRCTGKPQR